MKSIKIKNTTDLGESFNILREQFEKHGSIIVTIEVPDKKRTVSQNASLHKYCSDIAEAMTDAGFTQKELVGSFKEGFTLPVTMEMIKAIFREVGFAMFKKESTKDLTTIEIQEVYRVVDLRFSEICNIRREWPSIESMSTKALMKDKPRGK